MPKGTNFISKGRKPFFFCEICDYYSHSETAVKLHMKKTPNADGRLECIEDKPKCLVCGYSLNNIPKVRKHLIIHNHQK